MRDLDLDHIFAHGDEQVYARSAHINWKEPELYRDIGILMGGFHELHVRQKLFTKGMLLEGIRNG